MQSQGDYSVEANFQVSSTLFNREIIAGPTQNAIQSNKVCFPYLTHQINTISALGFWRECCKTQMMSFNSRLTIQFSMAIKWLGFNKNKKFLCKRDSSTTMIVNTKSKQTITRKTIIKPISFKLSVLRIYLSKRM